MSFVCTLIFKFLLGVLGNNALQLLQKGLLALIAAGHGIGGVTDFLRGSQFWNPEGGQVLDMEIAVLIYIGACLLYTSEFFSDAISYQPPLCQLIVSADAVVDGCKQSRGRNGSAAVGVKVLVHDDILGTVHAVEDV